MRKLIAGIVTLASAAALTVAAVAVSGSAQADQHPAAQHPGAQFAGQVRAAGLSADQASALQATVDREVAATGGKQVAANEVEWNGGKTVVPLPGESSVRNLAAPRGTMYRCPYHYMCVYTGARFAGTMHMLYHCREYATPYTIQSWVNNQSKGTRAEFRHYYHAPIYQTPGAPSYDTLIDKNLTRSTYYIKPCN
ncbi:peptidase inhibitor family I36 protein [Kribbella sp. NPDC051586]|uniref:peptidase inhibitor family I36 protein n=1 Tax=Kribbella sp. NPDC051586 TaxID=3364118 RepID=UPI0037924DB0